MKDFRELGLPEQLLAALAQVGYESPSPIQAATIPVLLGGGDMVGQAQTGTGKTAALALPILHREQASSQVHSRRPAQKLHAGRLACSGPLTTSILKARHVRLDRCIAVAIQR